MICRRRVIDVFSIFIRYAPNSLNLFYAFDGNKNVSDVFYRMTSNGIGAHYDYAPFGATTRTHRDASATTPLRSDASSPAPPSKNKADGAACVSARSL